MGSMAWQMLAGQADACLHTKAHKEDSSSWHTIYAALKTEEYAVAQKALHRHLAAYPNDHIAHDLHALCSLHGGDYQQALVHAMECTRLNPGWACGWARLGAAQLCLGHPKAAEAAYFKGLELDPKNQEMITGLELAKRGFHIRGGPARRAALHDA